MGNASSELQHIANALEGKGPGEKRFLEAAYSGNHEETKAALIAVPDVIYARTSGDWYNAWHIAANRGDIPLLEVLHRYGRGGKRKPLPGEPLPVNARAKNGATPLIVAVQGGHQAAMQYLLVVGAQVMERDNYGNTVVHYAALRGQIKILEILLACAEAEGDLMEMRPRYVDLCNEAGLQPLHFAVYGGQEEAVQVLLRYGALTTTASSADSTAELTCNSGSTLLHLAALRDDSEMVHFLLDYHSKACNTASEAGDHRPQDPRAIRDAYGFTPLQLAQALRRVNVLGQLDPRSALPDFRARAFLMRSVSINAARRRPASAAGAAMSASHSEVDGPILEEAEDDWARFPETGQGALQSRTIPRGPAAATKAVPALPKPPSARKDLRPAQLLPRPKGDGAVAEAVPEGSGDGGDGSGWDPFSCPGAEPASDRAASETVEGGVGMGAEARPPAIVAGGA